MSHKATWNGVVVAQTDNAKNFDGNVYFPPEALDRSVVEASSTHSTCPFKGFASYYTIVVNGKDNKDAACTTMVSGGQDSSRSLSMHSALAIRRDALRVWHRAFLADLDAWKDLPGVREAENPSSWLRF
ncbi:hypothetical protein BDK51DRAFT_26917 [Blyttiomyces helicus]|uniref:DUF427 domain-containing protein n=1 Tax=Blyttiomyces helicus TaxID=388810 RepID=A0A4P9W218_9FUNG|nr:hypothetical protein BDK51DRAFT_26917 [Blyttiomyces helicus]|eukprot:RKO85415.1 hypothetical protein BDK51DRAFT_26917 [Blyttiomyces helicus]